MKHTWCRLWGTKYTQSTLSQKRYTFYNFFSLHLKGEDVNYAEDAMGEHCLVYRWVYIHFNYTLANCRLLLACDWYALGSNIQPKWSCMVLQPRHPSTRQLWQVRRLPLRPTLAAHWDGLQFHGTTWDSSWLCHLDWVSIRAFHG